MNIKENIKNHKKAWAIGAVLFLSFGAFCSFSDDTESDIPEVVTTEENENVSKKQTVKSPTPSVCVPSPPPTVRVEYDSLQQLYLDIDSDMSYKEMLRLVKSSGLPYSVEKYNGSREIQVAFTEGCTVQKHKKESGDYLEIIYVYADNENSANDVLENYHFGTCCYNPIDSDLSLISHVSGAYFSYYEPGNYISDFGKTLDLDSEMSKKEQLDYYFENK